MGLYLPYLQLQGQLCSLVGDNIFFFYMYYIITLPRDENSQI